MLVKLIVPAARHTYLLAYISIPIINGTRAPNTDNVTVATIGKPPVFPSPVHRTLLTNVNDKCSFKEKTQNALEEFLMMHNDG